LLSHCSIGEPNAGYWYVDSTDYALNRATVLNLAFLDSATVLDPTAGSHYFVHGHWQNAAGILGWGGNWGVEDPLVDPFLDDRHPPALLATPPTRNGRALRLEVVQLEPGSVTIHDRSNTR